MRVKATEKGVVNGVRIYKDTIFDLPKNIRLREKVKSKWLVPVDEKTPLFTASGRTGAEKEKPMALSHANRSGPNRSAADVIKTFKESP